MTSDKKDPEKAMLDRLWAAKSSQNYSFTYQSSTVEGELASLGTIEGDVSGRYGRWKPEGFRADKFAVFLARTQKFKSVLDVGGGNFRAAEYFSRIAQKVDVVDFPNSPYRRRLSAKSARRITFIEGDFLTTDLVENYDLVWCSHVLEHQPNPGQFLKRLLERVSEGGLLAVVVPPRKPFIVSGHLNMFNPGLLIYRTIVAGNDCSSARIIQYDNNICLLTQRAPIELTDLKFDVGDLDLLRPYFPFEISEGFNGDFMSWGFTDVERAEYFS